MKYYEWDTNIGKFRCFRCGFTSDGHMGMQSHIRKHKRELRETHGGEQTLLHDPPVEEIIEIHKKKIEKRHLLLEPD